MTLTIWICALIAYLAFRFWYDGVRKPLSPQEIDEFMAVMERRVNEGLEQQDIAVLRRFLEEDDGKEFLMVNLLQFNPSPLPHPDSGADTDAPSLLQEYFKPLMKMFLKRAGHPVLTSRVVGGYIESWNTAADPGWHAAGIVRYRSRRDAMLASLASAEFDAIHKYKIAALNQTFAMPTQRLIGFYASPRVTVGLALALVASLLQQLIT